jgi:hypothetical protein
MNNYTSETQKKAVAQSCSQYNPNNLIRGFTNSTSVFNANMSCSNCENWNGQRCKINLFDKIVTSLDQT